jgi:hypothetical protein
MKSLKSRLGKLEDKSPNCGEYWTRVLIPKGCSIDERKRLTNEAIQAARPLAGGRDISIIQLVAV